MATTFDFEFVPGKAGRLTLDFTQSRDATHEPPAPDPAHYLSEAVMHRTVARFSAVFAAIVALSASAAAGQTSTDAPPAIASFVSGRNVKVTTLDGSSKKGVVTQVSPKEMVVGGVHVSYSDIAKIERPSYRILKGAAIGAAIGGGLVATVVGLCYAGGDEYCGTSQENTEGILWSAAFGAGIGAGIGALRDLVKKDENVLYFRERPSKTMAVMPIVSPTRKGVAVSMSWR